MTALIFVDTNVLIYALDQADRHKHQAGPATGRSGTRRDHRRESFSQGVNLCAPFTVTFGLGRILGLRAGGRCGHDWLLTGEGTKIAGLASFSSARRGQLSK